MNLLDSFVNNHLPTAKRHEELSKSMITYLGDDKIFVIGLGSISGVITEQKKAELLKRFKMTPEEVCFITLFYNKKTF
jgi:hypothetical protein